MSRRLLVVPVAPGDPGPVRAALLASLDGDGPPFAPVAADHPRPATLAGEAPVPPPGTAVAVVTSGSTAAPRVVALSRDALLASARATHAHLGGPGHWLLALPLTHIAGLQVLVRAAVAGTDPVVADVTAGFTPTAFTAATSRLAGRPRYTALVPTQVARLLADDDGARALAAYDAVLVGGAATDPALAQRAAAAGVTLVQTYGMTETAGGCVYDGIPLDGVEVRIEADGRVLLTGPVLATGYLGPTGLDPVASTTADGRYWLRTDDLGHLHADGRLTVLGRADDVIVTGGVNVSPAAVEGVLVELSAVAEACVVALPHPDWGSEVVAVVVGTGRLPALGDVRGHVAARLGAPAAPRRLLAAVELPRLGPGKVDRRAVARWAADQAGATGHR